MLRIAERAPAATAPKASPKLNIMCALLKNIDAVCNDLEIFGNPFGGCGKMAQKAFVGLRARKLYLKNEP